MKSHIYLDTNATTPVLPQARTAALAAMADDFGNPSSTHATGLRARALLDKVRACARRVLQAPTGRLLFNSGATEGIQTAALSALIHWRDRGRAGAPVPPRLLYGATEHKAVPEALAHWNALLGLDFDIQAIPVGQDGRHDLDWLNRHASGAALVCTMAANNETGVISDLDGLADALEGSPALWLVDGVQALGKVDLKLGSRRIDYAPFSGHKLYAPKGIGLLYVREGAPFSPLLAGGGQEDAARSGTENMAGIAAFGAVLAALEQGGAFAPQAELSARRERLAQALRDAFPGVVFNAPFGCSLPTTLNFSVPGVDSRRLLDLFDAAGLCLSGGSACGAARARPSYVLQAMGLPAWRTESAARLSIGAADDPADIDEACARLRACGDALRASGQGPQAPSDGPVAIAAVTRFAADGACCYVVADPDSRRCVVVDPQPAQAEALAQWLRRRGCEVAAVLGTADRPAAALPPIRAALREGRDVPVGQTDTRGWPPGADHINLGAQHRLTRLVLLPGARPINAAYLLRGPEGLETVLVGGALEREDGAALQALAGIVEPHTPLLLGNDGGGDCFVTTLAARRAVPLPHQATPSMAVDQDDATAGIEITPLSLRRALRAGPQPLLVDVRETYEALLGSAKLPASERVPLSELANALPRWAALPAGTPVVFFCRTGNRSAQAARALRRMGRAQAWSLAGGLALWSEAAPGGA